MERSKFLFGGYRRGDANDPDVYVASIAAVLACYEPEIIREVTDPRTGISTTEKFQTFMPNSGELKAYCDAVASQRARIANLARFPRQSFAALPRPPRPPLRPGARANVLIHKGAPPYADLVAKAKQEGERSLDWRDDERGRGIWVSGAWLDDGHGGMLKGLRPAATAVNKVVETVRP